MAVFGRSRTTPPPWGSLSSLPVMPRYLSFWVGSSLFFYLCQVPSWQSILIWPLLTSPPASYLICGVSYYCLPPSGGCLLVSCLTFSFAPLCSLYFLCYLPLHFNSSLSLPSGKQGLKGFCSMNLFFSDIKVTENNGQLLSFLHPDLYTILQFHLKPIISAGRTSSYWAAGTPASVVTWQWCLY